MTTPATPQHSIVNHRTPFESVEMIVVWAYLYIFNDDPWGGSWTIEIVFQQNFGLVIEPHQPQVESLNDEIHMAAGVESSTGKTAVRRLMCNFLFIGDLCKIRKL